MPIVIVLVSCAWLSLAAVVAQMWNYVKNNVSFMFFIKDTFMDANFPISYISKWTEPDNITPGRMWDSIFIFSVFVFA